MPSPVAMFVLAAVLVVQTGATPSPQMLWKVRMPQKVHEISMPGNAMCTLVETDTDAIVIDNRDNQTWSVDLPIAPAAMAVSPKCDWLALAVVVDPSNPSSKHRILIARKNGVRKEIPVDGVGIHPHASHL